MLNQLKIGSVIFMTLVTLFFGYLCFVIYPSVYWKANIFEDTKSLVFNTELFVYLMSTILVFFGFSLPAQIKESLTTRQLFLGLGVFFASVFFVLGLFTPLFETTAFWIFKEEVILTNAIFFLYEHSQFFLATILLIFSIIFPLFKNILLYKTIFSRGVQQPRLVRWISNLGKWSMLDVFVIAITIIILKFQHDIVSVGVLEGTYFFAISILLTNLITFFVSKKNIAK